MKSFWLWLLAALLLLAFGIRANGLAAADLTFDECASAFISGKPYGDMLAYLRQAFHELPPAYYVILRTWTLAAGRSEYALRFPSVWFGVLTIALLYRVGRSRIGRTATLVAVTLLAVQSFHIHYSQDARPYALMILEGLVLFEVFQHVRNGRRWYGWGIFGALAVVAVLTHYVMAFVLIAINLYALSTLNFKRSTLNFAAWWFGAQALVGGLFAIYLFSSKAARNLLRELQGFTLQSILGRLGPAWKMADDLLWGVQAHPWPSWTQAILALVVLGIILSLVWLPRQRKNQPGQWGRWLLPLYLLVPIALVIASPERLNARYAAAIIPAYCLILGVSIAWLGQRHWLIGLVAWGALMGANIEMSHINLDLIKSDYGRVTNYLNAHLQAGDAIIFNGPWQWVQQLYYPVKPLANTVADIRPNEDPVGRLYAPLNADAPTFWLPPHLPLDPATTQQELEKIAGQFDRVWVLPAAVQDTDPEQVVAGWLTEHAYYTSNYQELELYTFDHAGSELTHTIRADFGDVFRLRQVNLSNTQVHPGEPVLVSLPLRVLNPPGGDLALALQLVDRDGNTWASLALRPGDRFYPPWQWQTGEQLVARQGVIVPVGAPPGDYLLRVGAIRYPSEAVLEPSVNGNPLPDPYIEVGGITVTPCTDCPPTQFDDKNITPLNAIFDNALSLTGIHLAGQEFWQGHYLAFELLWRPERTLEKEYRLRIALVDSSGQEVASDQTQPVADWYPTTQWSPGQPIMDRQALLIPPKQAPGTYTLRISVLGPDDQPVPITGTQTQTLLGIFQRTVVLSGTTLDTSQITVRARQRDFRAGKISHPLDVTLGDSVRLLGYDWDGPPQPGRDVQLVLYWQTMREMDTSYTVFTHIIGPGTTLAGQKDSAPRDGDYPTHFWMKGEVIRDEYLIPFLSQATPGNYWLEVGMYTKDTGDRLPAVQDGQPVLNNAIILERFTIK